MLILIVIEAVCCMMTELTVCETVMFVFESRHRLKGIHSRSDTNRTGVEGLSSYLIAIGLSSYLSAIAKKTILVRHTAEATHGLGMGCWC